MKMKNQNKKVDKTQRKSALIVTTAMLWCL